MTGKGFTGHGTNWLAINLQEVYYFIGLNQILGFGISNWEEFSFIGLTFSFLFSIRNYLGFLKRQFKLLLAPGELLTKIWTWVRMGGKIPFPETSFRITRNFPKLKGKQQLSLAHKR